MISQSHYRPPVIKALNALWRTLPLRGVADTEGVLDDYCFALADCPVDAVIATVNDLRAGRIAGASRDFCPTAPRLADYIRAEQRRLAEAGRPSMVSPRPVARAFHDWRIVQRRRADELVEKGFVLVAANCSQDMACAATRRRRWRPGTIWFWCLQEAWGPPV